MKAILLGMLFFVLFMLGALLIGLFLGVNELRKHERKIYEDRAREVYGPDWEDSDNWGI